MDKKLLTPGPLTTSLSTKEAMLHDWGSRDQNFIELNHSIRESLVKLIEGQDNYQCVPMQKRVIKSLMFCLSICI